MASLLAAKADTNEFPKYLLKVTEMATIGRNDPCPCGSGKKYKRCCLDKDASNDTMQRLKQQLQDEFADENPETLADAQAMAGRVMNGFNATPPPEFHGLSPTQMHRLLNHPFDSPDLVEFPAVLDTEPDAPAMTLLQLLIEGIGEQGVKATAKDNLPQKLVQHIAAAMGGVQPWSRWPFDVALRSEEDFRELHVIRITAELAGLIRIDKGRYRLTGRGLKLAEQGPTGLYPALLKAYVRKFNWAYSDGYGDMRGVQHTVPFTLYLLSLHGTAPHKTSFYEDAFLDAFPMVIDEASGDEYSPPEQTAARCYNLRTLVRFAEFFGLIRRDVPDPHYPDLAGITATPLLAAAVRFNTKLT